MYRDNSTDSVDRLLVYPVCYGWSKGLYTVLWYFRGTIWSLSLFSLGALSVGRVLSVS